ncbi:hypothetical protein [Nonomuraea sp. NPDC050202]|uniref:hypothetical protein n=1 Tax=Nonomuraea sp. NPDC050202 TaxID=3155035 RepID=UPI0033FB1DA6
MPVPWLSVLLIGIALVCSVIRMREQARRRSEQNIVLEIALPPLAALRLHLVALAALVWTCLTFAIDKPVGALVGVGSAGVAAVICAGLALGAAGMPQIALGAALCQVLWLPDSVVTAVWALPITVGYLLRLVHIGPQYWRGYPWLLLLLDKQGTVIRGSMPAEWFWRGLQAGTAVVPVSAAALLPAPGLGTADVVARWTGALVVAAELTLSGWNMRAIANRKFRLLTRIGGVLGAVTLFAVAASPAAAWVAARWASVPFLTGPVGGALLAGVATGLWATLEAVKSRNAVSGLPRWAQLLQVARTPFHGGLAAVCLALLHPLPGLALAAAVLAAAEAAGLFVGRNRHYWDHQRVRNAASFLRDDDREALLGGWLHDAFLSRPARPDFSLARTLGGLATLSVQGWMVPGQAPVTGGAPELKRPLTGIAALRWTDLTARALDLVEAEVVPRCPPAHLAALERGAAEARAELSWNRAIVLHLAGETAAALDQWRDAALRYRRIGAPVHELVARLVMVYLLALPLARPADAHREHARLRQTRNLPPAVRKLALIADAATALARGDADAARPALATASRAEAGTRVVRAALAADAGLPDPDRRQCMALAVLTSQAEAALRERGGDGR